MMPEPADTSETASEPLLPAPSWEPPPLPRGWQRAEYIELLDDERGDPERVPVEAVLVTEHWVTTQEGGEGIVYPARRVHEIHLADVWRNR